jgi:hypothetical protein
MATSARLFLGFLRNWRAFLDPAAVAPPATVAWNFSCAFPSEQVSEVTLL